MNKKNIDNQENLSESEDNVSENEENHENEEENNKNEEIYNTDKKNKPLLQSRRIKIEKPNNYNQLEATREIKKILSDYNYDIEKFIKKYSYHKKRYGLNEDEINNIVELYEIKNNQIEDEINLIIDMTNGNIPESLYNYCENYLDRINNKVEKNLLC